MRRICLRPPIAHPIRQLERLTGTAFVASSIDACGGFPLRSKYSGFPFPLSEPQSLVRDAAATGGHSSITAAPCQRLKGHPSWSVRRAASASPTAVVWAPAFAASPHSSPRSVKPTRRSPLESSRPAPKRPLEAELGGVLQGHAGPIGRPLGALRGPAKATET